MYPDYFKNVVPLKYFFGTVLYHYRANDMRVRLSGGALYKFFLN